MVKQSMVQLQQQLVVPCNLQPPFRISQLRSALPFESAKKRIPCSYHTSCILHLHGPWTLLCGERGRCCKQNRRQLFPPTRFGLHDFFNLQDWVITTFSTHKTWPAMTFSTRNMTKYKHDWACLVKPITRHTCWNNRLR